MATTTKRPPADPETDDLGLGFDYWFLQVARVRRVEEYRRCQAVVRHAYPQVPDSLGPLDDEYCAAWRTAMLAAGATERDLDVLAVLLVLRVIMLTERDSSDRRDLIECIARHLAGTSMVIRIGRVANYVVVEFPDRPRIH
jgi:hypothetical protein